MSRILGKKASDETIKKIVLTQFSLAKFLKHDRGLCTNFLNFSYIFVESSQRFC